MKETRPNCRPEDHEHDSRALSGKDLKSLQRAAELFEAMGDQARLQILRLLMRGQWCVTELVAALGEKFSTVSQRLRILRDRRLVVRQRQGTHILYSLADSHVIELIKVALAHADEPVRGSSRAGEKEQEGTTMAHVHSEHNHTHGTNCGHTPVKHDGHVDYLHDGHLHHQRADGVVEEHVLPVTAKNPAGCTPQHKCDGHDGGHVHGPGCGHEAVPHGDHVDYIVAGHLHHQHGNHCDDHGPLERA
jgi:DNA-binding transcriptional ArsR family regulator